MADLRRQKDSPIQIAYVIPIHLPPAADAQAHASVRGNWRFPHIFQKMGARIRVSTKSLIDNMADQWYQRNVLGPSESFLRQQKRLRANKVAMCRNERLNPQTLKGQAFCCVWEKEFQCFEKHGIAGEKRAQSFLHDRSVALAEGWRVTMSLLDDRLYCSLRRRTCSRRLAPSFGLPLLNPHCAIDHPIEPDRASGISGLAGAEVGCSTQRLHLPQRRA